MKSSFDLQSPSRAEFVAAPLFDLALGFEPLAAGSGSNAEPSIEERLQAAFEEGRAAGRAELPWNEAQLLSQAAEALGRGLQLAVAREQEWQEAVRESALTLAFAITKRLVGRAVQVDRDALAAQIDAGLQLVQGPGATELALAPEDHAVLMQGQAPELARLVQEHGARLVPDDELRPGQARILGGAARTRRVVIDLDSALEVVERELRTLLPMRSDRQPPSGTPSPAAALVADPGVEPSAETEAVPEEGE